MPIAVLIRLDFLDLGQENVTLMELGHPSKNNKQSNSNLFENLLFFQQPQGSWHRQPSETFYTITDHLERGRKLDSTIVKEDSLSNWKTKSSNF